MSATKRFSAVFTAVLVSAALVALAMHSTATGAKPGVVVNRPISYVTSTSSFNIQVVDEKGSSSVTVSRGILNFPRWSPDGLLIGGQTKWLGNDHAIMAMSPSGANEQIVLTEGEFLAWNLSRHGVQSSTGFDFFSSNCWLGTDAFIFTGSTTYVDERGQTLAANRLFIVDSIGAITPLTESAPHAAIYDFDPHFSAALKKVVFATQAQADPELYAINPDGTGIQQITDFRGGVNGLHWPVWSPTGDRIVVSLKAGTTSHWQLWILDVDLAQSNPVTAIHPFKVVDNGGGHHKTAAWSPDGKRIVFSRVVYDSRNRSVFELVIADAVSGAETVIKRSSSNIETPDWNPVP